MGLLSLRLGLLYLLLSLGNHLLSFFLLDMLMVCFLSGHGGAVQGSMKTNLYSSLIVYDSTYAVFGAV
jgi:hypothetical protein